MNKFRTLLEFLEENNVTDKDMDTMWAFMYDKNWKVKNLTDHGKDWTDLSTSAMKSLIDIYSKARTVVAN